MLEGKIAFKQHFETLIFYCFLDFCLISEVIPPQKY